MVLMVDGALEVFLNPTTTALFDAENGRLPSHHRNPNHIML
jgi:hypothetical protein